MRPPADTSLHHGHSAVAADGNALSRTVAVVVHHRNFPDVVDTVERIVASGIGAANVIVVDNSEDAELLEALTAAVPKRVRVRSTANEGYGFAVNAAVREFAEADPAPEYVLVSTHETRPEPGAIAALFDALDADHAVGAAGPTLVTDDDGRRITWSRGGRLTRVLNEPRHFGERDAWDPAVTEADPALRHWVDGAFVAYRFDLLASLGVREDFFLYFEETELHARIRAAGRLVLWVPSAVVWQSSGGTPAKFIGRNLQRFQMAHGTRFQRAVTVPYVMLRAGVRKALRGGPANQRRDMLRGWWEA